MDTLSLTKEARIYNGLKTKLYFQCQVKAVYGPKPSHILFLHCPSDSVGPCEAGSTAPKHTDNTSVSFLLPLLSI